jgi:ribonuclease HI
MTVYAAMQALTYIRTKIQQKEVLRSNRIQQIVLVCDSEYLLEAITHNVLHWRAAHWRAERGGKLVRNARLMQKLDDLVCQFEDEGITVEFWEVERELNEDATEFAARALRGESACLTIEANVRPQR